MATALVNQVPYDFQSLETELLLPAAGSNASSFSFGIIEGLDKIDYTATINRTEIYGRSRLPLMTTSGDVQFDASIDVHRYWWHMVRSNAQQLGIPLAKLEMILAITFYAPDQTLHTDTLTGVKLKEIKNSSQHGPDPVMVSMPLRVGNIYYDGEDVWGNKL